MRYKIEQGNEIINGNAGIQGINKMNKIENNLTDNLFIQGMAFGFLAKSGYYSSEKAFEQVDKMAECGVKWVCIMVSVVQDAFYSTKVYHDYEYTPSDFEVEKIIEYCQNRGMRVMLKIINLSLDSYTHSRIGSGFAQQPPQLISGVKTDYFSAWFKSFGDCVVNYGKLMERVNGDIFCLSGELGSTERQTGHWRKVVERVREVYSGALTYEIDKVEYLLEEEIFGWAKDLDLITTSFYPRIEEKSCCSCEEMVIFLKKTALKECRKAAEKIQRPFFFAEVGCRSTVNTGVYTSSWTSWNMEAPYDGQAQADYFEAIMKTFWDEDWWQGLFWWKWDEQQSRPQYHIDPKGDCGFTVEGKPACKSICEWYNKNRDK